MYVRTYVGMDGWMDGCLHACMHACTVYYTYIMYNNIMKYIHIVYIVHIVSVNVWTHNLDPGHRAGSSRCPYRPLVPQRRAGALCHLLIFVKPKQ